GGARNYRVGVTLGATSAQGQSAGQLSMTAATHLVVLEGSITVRSSDQVVEQRICSAGGSTSIGSMSTTAAEDVAEGVALNPLLWTNTSTTTQTVQALSFKAWLWRS